MTTGGPTTAREAALKILLGEIEPLIQRVEDAALLLKRTEGEINDDLKSLGRGIEQIGGTLNEIQTAANKVFNTVQRAETLVSATLAQQRKPQSPKPAGIGAGQVLVACLLSAVLAAAAVGGTLFWLGRDLVDQARVGRSLQKAWPKLDDDTRKRVEQLLR